MRKFLPLLALLPGLAFGAPTVDESAASTSFGNDSTSISHTLDLASGNARLVVCGAMYEDNTGSISGLTYDGVAMTSAGSVSESQNKIEAFYMLDGSLPASSGTYTVAMTTSGGDSGSGGAAIGCQAFSGDTLQSAPEVHTASGTSTNNVTDTVPFADSGDVLLKWSSAGTSGETHTHGAGSWTEIMDISEGTTGHVVDSSASFARFAVASQSAPVVETTTSSNTNRFVQLVVRIEGAAPAAETGTTINMTSCPSSGSFTPDAYRTDRCGPSGNRSCCPPIVSDLVGEADGTTISGSFATTQNFGTAYACLYPSSASAPADCDAVQACSGGSAVAGRSPAVDAITSRANLSTVAGLSNATSYTWYACHPNGRPEAQVIASDAIVTAPSQPDPAPSGDDAIWTGIQVADDGTCEWYFDSNASPGGNGTSDAQAFDSLNDWNSVNPSTGDDICLKKGSVFEDQTITISHNGNAADWVKVRCYEGSGDECDGRGRAAAAIFALTGDSFYEDAETDYQDYPEINGNFEDSCNFAGTCPYNTGAAIPSSRWSGLVQINSDYVSVERIKTYRSAAQGVGTNRDDFSGLGGRRYIALRFTENYRTAEAPFVPDTGAAYVLAEWNWSEESAITNRVDYDSNNDGVDDTFGAPHPRGYSTARTFFTLMQFNWNARYGGEVSNCFRNSYCVGRYIFGGQNGSAGMYSDNSRYVLHESVHTWGGNPVDQTPVRWGSQTRGGGSNFAREWYGSCFNTNNFGGDFDTYPQIQRNNRITNGASISGGTGDARHATECGNEFGLATYNNTVMEPVGSAAISGFQSSSAFFKSGAVHMINNILYKSGENACGYSYSGANWVNNRWSQTPGSNCQGTGDDNGDPQLQGSNWSQKYTDNKPTAADFTPASGSPVIDAGVALTQVATATTGTAIQVDHAGFFTDGMPCNQMTTEAGFRPTIDGCNVSPAYLDGTAYEGEGRLIEGDIIQIGDDTGLRILHIDYDTDTITVDQSITVAVDDDVCWESCTINQGADPDYFAPDSELSASSL